MQVNRIRKGDQLSFDRYCNGMAWAFYSDNTPISRAITSEIDEEDPSNWSQERVLRHFTPGLTSALENGADFVEAGNFSALACWETTSYQGQAFSETATKNVGPIREEWRTKVSLSKETHIGTEVRESGKVEVKPFYHLGFLARNPEVSEVRGAISAVVRPYLERAEDEGVPVWLEATTRRAVEIYEHFGFRLVETITVGVGKRDAAGLPRSGGEGTSGYAMIYDKHLRQ